MWCGTEDEARIEADKYIPTLPGKWQLKMDPVCGSYQCKLVHKHARIKKMEGGLWLGSLLYGKKPLLVETARTPKAVLRRLLREAAK